MPSTTAVGLRLLSPRTTTHSSFAAALSPTGLTTSGGSFPRSDLTSTPDDSPLCRLRLDLAYDGTEFSGWARQNDRRTVAGVLEAAIATISRWPAAGLTVAGRTDAGVHATGQVAHVDVPATVWQSLESSMLRRLNGVLPADIRVHRVAPAPAGFNARFGALWRQYEYRLSDSPWGAEPLRRRDVVAVARRLDTDAMAAAAADLLGQHDFAAFCRRREGASTVRGLQRLDVHRDGDLIRIEAQADAFCHSMVRSLVGSLIAVGEARHPSGWPASLLAQRTRSSSVPVAPAHGLTLVEVAYPPDDELSERATTTRNRRSG